MPQFYFTSKYEFKSEELPIELIRPKINIFKIKNSYNSSFKHWGIILELSNGSYVNIIWQNLFFSQRI